jgi:hypothetical protein
MKGLTKFARRERIADASLKEAIERAERRGRGRSGGYRMMIAYLTKDRAFFLLGFAKNERENVSPDELAALRKLSEVWLNVPDARLDEAIDEEVLREVLNDEEIP